MAKPHSHMGAGGIGVKATLGPQVSKPYTHSKPAHTHWIAVHPPDSGVLSSSDQDLSRQAAAADQWQADSFPQDIHTYSSIFVKATPQFAEQRTFPVCLVRDSGPSDEAHQEAVHCMEVPRLCPSTPTHASDDRGPSGWDSRLYGRQPP